jgi:hypothetical protein
MKYSKRQQWRGICLIGCLLGSSLAHRASAQPTTNRAASILFFPRVVADDVQDTVIQISNTSNSRAAARCFYRRADSGEIAAGFTIQLTRQQPTAWVVSKGRTAGTAPPGVDVGAVPPMPVPFQGLLLCINAFEDGSPIPQNSLIGEATVEPLATGDAEKYNAIGARGDPEFPSRFTLCLGGSVSDDCPNGPQYDGCPNIWLLDHAAYGATDAQIGAPGVILTDVTFVSCSQDLTASDVKTIGIQISVVNELEQQFTATRTVAWGVTTSLADISSQLTAASLGTARAVTRFQPSQATAPGFIMVAREVHSDGAAAPLESSAGINLYPLGLRTQGDTIILPPQ